MSGTHDRLRVLSLNIWNRNGPYEARFALMRKLISEHAPDVVGLQEVLCHDGHSQAHDLAEGTDYHVAFGRAHELGAGVLFGNAVLSRFPIAASQALPLPVREGEEHRCLLHAQLEAPAGPLPVFVTHLNWMFHHGIVRERQVVAIAREVARLAPMRGLPPVLMGDFNAAPDAAEIRFLVGLQSLEGQSTYFADCHALAGEGPGYSFDARHNPHAAPTREPPRRIDYVFVRGPDAKGRGLPLSCRVAGAEVVGGACASDHYGVLAEISL